MNKGNVQPDVLGPASDSLPPFTAREREVLLALIDLWEATGDPQSVAGIARQLGRPADAIWGHVNVCHKLRLVWIVWPKTAVVDGYVPLVLRDQVPDAEADPDWHRHANGWSKREAGGRR